MKSDTAHDVKTSLLEEPIRYSVHPIIERDTQKQNAIQKKTKLNEDKM